MQADLLSGTVDVATGVGPGAPASRHSRSIDVPPARRRPGRPPLADEPLIDVSSSAQPALVLAQEGSFSRGIVIAACARAGFEPTIGFDSPNPLSILALGEAGLGFPSCSTERHRTRSIDRGRRWPRRAGPSRTPCAWDGEPDRRLQQPLPPSSSSPAPRPPEIAGA
jgi:hypothetical protein